MARSRVGKMAVRRRGPWTKVLLALIVFVFCLIGWGGWRGWCALLESDFMTLQYLELEGCRVIPDSLVLRRLEPLLGRPLHTVKSDSLERALSDIPRVDRLRIQRRLPGTLRCRIEESVPTALWFDGRFVEIDRQGTLMPRFGNPPPDLPIIRASKVIPADSLRGLALLALEALKASDFDLIQEVSEVCAEQTGIVYIRSESATRVLLGWNDFMMRVRCYREVYQRIVVDGFPPELDLRFRDQVVARDSISAE
ncbi:MAG: FtsQ-type POTRA domain-containing protein [bacterium]|nr:FtsQ-type POTRA domain-containing protein [bacterium]